MAFCETHKNAHAPMCPVCMMQERDSVQAKNEQLREALKPFVSVRTINKWDKDDDEHDHLIPAKWIKDGELALE